ncbi:hypothetical protein BDV25DRAFT_171741 [Aspergillus avenaceus]|uniref:Zn(2)-C6 fungal-type domain-containing protein n=1 Tax=Aspergillus avenaceus TaxID=36643 RepID=A0A5N6TXB2_ASPAV|nr:hypothetical protein BDV25DRAFT_171741 [Aspergillus avenaceus]
MPRTSQRSRPLACARCFRLKRKCDHARPLCGECKRRGAECLPANSYKDGDDVTVPLKYLRHLESRLAELEQILPTSEPLSQTRDIAVQTDALHRSECGPMSDCDFIYDCNINIDEGINSLAQTEVLNSSSQRDTVTGGDEPARPLSRPSKYTVGTMNGINSDKPSLSGLLHDLIRGDEDTSRLEGAYANFYFAYTHCGWPFLDRSDWAAWRDQWTLGKQEGPWKGFFVDMVYAIGALTCNTFQPTQGHLERAADLYTSALSYYPYVMEEASTVLQVQASILLIIYSLHCPSAREISMAVASIAPFCSVTVTEMQKRATDSDGPVGSTTTTGDGLTESQFITCYMLNEILISGWERPVSEVYKAVDHDMNALSNKIQEYSSTNSALQHLFKLRKIQANIRRHWGEATGHKNSDYASLKLALDAWREEIPRYSMEEARSTYLHPVYMAKLYDYSVMILMQDKRTELDPEDVQYILIAGVEVCLNFRRLQEEGQANCYTWSALVFQFRAGIMLLYILWSPSGPTVKPDSIRQAFDAVCACADSLTCFARRWKDAMPYLETLYFLIHCASWVPKELSSQVRGACSPDEFETFMGQLKRQYLHRSVLEMINDMRHKSGADNRTCGSPVDVGNAMDFV